MTNTASLFVSGFGIRFGLKSVEELTQRMALTAEQRKHRQTFVFGIALMVCGYVIFLLNSSKTSSATDVLPRSVMRHSDASSPGGNASFTLEDKLYSGTTYITDLEQDMYDIAKHEVTSRNQPGEVHFTFMVSGPDMYGKSANMLAFDISYSMDDLKQVNWANIGPMRLLNLATILDVTPEGKKLLQDYCGGNADISDAFCASAEQRFPPD
jgi:hypothetical protein